MKAGDVGTGLVFTIVDQNGTPVDLSAVSAVKLIMAIGGEKFERFCNIVDAGSGKVRYTVNTGDLSQPGVLSMELKVLFGDGRVFTTSPVQETVEATL